MRAHPDENAEWTGPLPAEEDLQRASKTMRLLSSPVRLGILCNLLKHGEMGVGALHEAVGLSQSALSQHLAKFREMGVVSTRREQQRIYYRIARDDIQAVMATLHAVYCGAGRAPRAFEENSKKK
jgi:DNA-binding transcriptional ArsR family regulator